MKFLVTMRRVVTEIVSFNVDAPNDLAACDRAEAIAESSPPNLYWQPEDSSLEIVDMNEVDA